jgi:hypothetical protein
MARQRPQDAVLKALQSYDPRQPVIVSKKLAAYSQLATAIWLWFNYGDPVSIRTLAAASQGILESLAGKTHQLPHMRNWTKKFPRRAQKILRDHRIILSTVGPIRTNRCDMIHISAI